MKLKKIIIKKVLKFRNNLADEIAYKINRINLIQYLNQRNFDSYDKIIDETNHGLTVSLTTFGTRINETYLAIESIGLQTLKPGRIVLWLTEGEYNHLPSTLKKLQKRGLTINYYKDIKAYKKLIPSIRKYPNDIIITIDDDIIYGRELVENLYMKHKEYNNTVCCGDAKLITTLDKKLTPYNTWHSNTNETYHPNAKTFPIGFAGTLYFPGCFHTDILNEEKFMKLCPYNDDIWFKSMCLLNNTLSMNINNTFSSVNTNIPIQKAQKDSLSMINVVKNENDNQLQNLLKEYPELIRKISN